MAENVLFICGSLNQTTMLHKVQQHMSEYNCYFTPYYADGIEQAAARAGLLDFTVLGGRHLHETKGYLARNRLPVDERGEKNNYDLVITSSDLIIQRNIRGKRLVLIQEGITEPETWVYWMVKWLKLPRYLANTSTNGLSDAYDIFCVASEGYAKHFVRKGVHPEKIAVTGTPNFDDLQKNLTNDFPYRGFVLAATSPLRESFRYDDRIAFIRHCVAIAAGRSLIFKLHPTENIKRAIREIERYAPGAMVLTHGNVNHMIANAAVVMTQQSTCTFVAVGLGKEVHTNLNMEELKRLMPIQNNGISARRIAEISKRVLRTPLPVLQQIRRGTRARPKWEKADSVGGS
ncbi:MAG TPA: hypothetical protein VHP14_15790 [Anaerolineales bacterium]|nr:hypothetical protein [Anaerolineales bacterium]